MNWKRYALAALGVAAAAVPAAWAAGMWPTLPQVGQPSFCGSIVGSGPTQLGTTGQGAGTTVTGAPSTYCGQTIPAGPTDFTGSELVPMDTQLSGGAPPQTVTAPFSAFASGVQAGNYRNLLVGGDFGTNPWQRGTTLSGITNTLAYGADRWFAVAGASTQGQVTRQTGASDITTGFAASMRVARNSGTSDTTAICTGQVLTSANSTQLQGKSVAFSFYALAGGNFSASNSNINVTVGYGTGTDQTAATFAAGTWTGFTSVTLTPAQINGSSVTAAAGIAQAISTTWTRYSFTGAIPATATQVGVKICFTPVGTASTNDWFEVTGAQLEALKGSTGIASAFERRTREQEVALAQAYTFALAEPAASNIVAAGIAVATNGCQIEVAYPVPMRGTTSLSTNTAGTFAVKTSSNATANVSSFTAVSTSMSNLGGTLSTNTATSTTAGNACPLTGAGGTGSLIFSAEL